MKKQTNKKDGGERWEEREGRRKQKRIGFKKRGREKEREEGGDIFWWATGTSMSFNVIWMVCCGPKTDGSWLHCDL